MIFNLYRRYKIVSLKIPGIASVAYRVSFIFKDNFMYTPAEEKRLEALGIYGGTERIPRHKLHYKGSYDEYLSDHWKTYVIDKAEFDKLKAKDQLKKK